MNYGHGDKPYDPIEKLDLEDGSGFKQLRKVAEQVLGEILGPSVEEAEIRAAEQDVERMRHSNAFVLERYRKEGATDEEWANIGHHLHTEEEMKAVDRVRELTAARQHGTWLKDRLTGKILSHIDTILLKLIGIKNDGFNRIETENGSPVALKLKEMATKIGNEVAEKWATDNASLASESAEALDKLVKKARWQDADGRMRWQDAIGARWKDELETAVANAMKLRVQAMAAERVQEINDDVFRSAVNGALLAKYPLLRKMEAAARLAAKTDTTE